MLSCTVNILRYLQKTSFKSSLLQLRPALTTEVKGEFETMFGYGVCFGHPFLLASKGLWGELTSRVMRAISHHSRMRSFPFMTQYTI